MKKREGVIDIVKGWDQIHASREQSKFFSLELKGGSEAAFAGQRKTMNSLKEHALIRDLAQYVPSYLVQRNHPSRIKKRESQYYFLADTDSNFLYGHIIL